MSKAQVNAVVCAVLLAILFGFPFASVVFADAWSGTGFIVGKLPVVVTNHHVAANAKQIRMTFRDGRTVKGRVLRLDKNNDLALIGFETKPGDKPPEVRARFKITHSDHVRPGQEVYVMGYPLRTALGNRLSITKGVIASIVGFDENNAEFRFTAEINPGNSGGPLLDAKGRVIGVVEAYLGPFMRDPKTVAIPQGANFAVKSSLLVSMLADFAEEEVSDGADLPELTGDRIFTAYQDAIVLIQASDQPEKAEKAEEQEQQSQGAEYGTRDKAAPALPDRGESIAWAKKARDSVGKGAWAEAIRAANAAIAADPALPGPYADRCLAFYKRGLYDDAASDCNRAISLDANNDLAYSYRALVYSEKGFTDQALIDAEHAIVLSPKNMSHYNNRGVVHEKRGAKEKAKADYEQACRAGVETGCQNFKRLMGFALAEVPKMVKDLLEESRGYFDNGQMERVIETSSKVIKLDPQSDVAYANRGGAYANKRQFTQAVQDCNAAIRINPDSGLAYNNKGFVCEQLGQTNEAVLNYEISCNLGVQLGCGNYSRMTGKRAGNGGR